MFGLRVCNLLISRWLVAGQALDERWFKGVQQGKIQQKVIKALVYALVKTSGFVHQLKIQRRVFQALVKALVKTSGYELQGKIQQGVFWTLVGRWYSSGSPAQNKRCS